MTRKGIALALVLSLLVANVAQAAANDWRIYKRNADDTEDVISAVPTAATSSPRILGGLPGGEGAVWYYLPSEFNYTQMSNAPYSGSKISLALDLGAFNPLNIGNMTDLLDAKISTSTFNSLSSTVSSLSSQIAGMNSMGTTTVRYMTKDVYDVLSQATSSAATAQAFAIQRANHTGSQAISTITNLQTNLDGKASTTHTHVANDISNATTVGKNVLTAADASAARAVLGAGTSTFSGSYLHLTDKPALSVSYEGTTQRTGTISIFKNATVASGVAVFHLTADGTSGGAALFPNGIIQDSIDVEVNDAAASYQMSYALSNGNKTVTVTANKLTTANILSGVLGQAQANGSVVRLMVQGY